MGRIHDAGRALDALCDEIVDRYHGPLHRLLRDGTLELERRLL